MHGGVAVKPPCMLLHAGAQTHAMACYDNRIPVVTWPAEALEAELEVVEPGIEAEQDAQVAASPEMFEPLVVVPEVAQGRYLGAALYYPALRALGLVEAALSSFQLPNSELFGVRAVTLTLFFLTLFSKTTVEAAKHLRRWEFGPLVGRLGWPPPPWPWDSISNTCTSVLCTSRTSG
jgi:hypothetical protein